jgi:hypothetical protein
MKCPHCAIHFHDNWQSHHFYRTRDDGGKAVAISANADSLWVYRTAHCPGCKNYTFEIAAENKKFETTWRQVYPTAANRGPVPTEVPPAIAEDYMEACNVLPISPKASAALSRRCLQNMLHQQGYVSRDLAKEIDLLSAEPDPRKALTELLRTTVDGIRHFRNFSAHPIDEKTTLQVIAVEPYEAEACLETIEELFQHFYVGPAKAKARKAALDAKLAAAGKPMSRS